MRPRVLAAPRPGCPHPEKRAFRNKRDATRALAYSRTITGHLTAQGLPAGHPPTAAYRCRCTAWHLTSQPQHRKDAA